MDLQALDHLLQKCPSAAGCSPQISKGARMCPTEVARDGLRDGGRRGNVCSACTDPEHPRERVSATSYTEGSCSRRGLSFLASTPRAELKAGRTHQMFILKGTLDLPTASSALAFLLRQEGQYLLFSGSYGLATNTRLHEAQHYQGFLTVSQESKNLLRGFINEWEISPQTANSRGQLFWGTSLHSVLCKYDF